MRLEELRHLLGGLRLRGERLAVHASLSSFGRVEGGADTVCQALIESVGPEGTILMPAFTYVETLGAEFEPNADARQVTRTAAFHPELPVSREIGAVAEAFRRLPGVMRSNHPTHSFSAWGRDARAMLSTQRDNNLLGPLKKLNVVRGQILLLGTTLASATAIHLAEEQLRMPYLGRRTAVRINAAGYDERVVLDNVPGCSRAFARLEDVLDLGKTIGLSLPRGTARKVPIRYLVNLATQLLEDDPAYFVCDDADCASCAAKRTVLARHSAARG
jgi:aminoglycoside 3-N-acetyltransferase